MHAKICSACRYKVTHGGSNDNDDKMSMEQELPVNDDSSSTDEQELDINPRISTVVPGIETDREQIANAEKNGIGTLLQEKVVFVYRFAYLWKRMKENQGFGEWADKFISLDQLSTSTTLLPCLPCPLKALTKCTQTFQAIEDAVLHYEQEHATFIKDNAHRAQGDAKIVCVCKQMGRSVSTYLVTWKKGNGRRRLAL